MANEPAAGAGTTEAGKGAGAPAAAAAAAAATGATGATAGDGGKGTAGEGKAGEGTAPAGAGAGSGTTASDSGGKADEGNPQSKAPEKYELSVPKGAEDYVDASDLERFTEIAKANGWSNEEAQAYTEQVADAIAEQSAAFRSRTEADQTYGGKNLQATQQAAARVLDRFAPKGDPLGDEFRSILVKTGYGNNLAILAFIAKIGKSMGEDAPGSGRGEGGGKKSAAEVLYSDTPAE